MRWVGYTACWLTLTAVTLLAIEQATTNGQVVAYALTPAALWLAGWSLLPEPRRRP